MKTKSTATVTDSATLSQSRLLFPSPTDPWTAADMWGCPGHTFATLKPHAWEMLSQFNTPRRCDD